MTIRIHSALSSAESRETPMRLPSSIEDRTALGSCRGTAMIHDPWSALLISARLIGPCSSRLLRTSRLHGTGMSDHQIFLKFPQFCKSFLNFARIYKQDLPQICKIFPLHLARWHANGFRKIQGVCKGGKYHLNKQRCQSTGLYHPPS